MTKRDSKKELPEEIENINEEIARIRKQIFENIKTKKEIPSHIVSAIMEVEDQTAYVNLLETELKNTENILRPLERIDKAVTDKVSKANARLQKIVANHEEKRAAANTGRRPY